MQPTQTVFDSTSTEQNRRWNYILVKSGRWPFPSPAIGRGRLSEYIQKVDSVRRMSKRDLETHDSWESGLNFGRAHFGRAQLSHHEPGAAITNRPDSEERENQERLPPRGQAKAGD
jgi:hypothetical protein